MEGRYSNLKEHVKETESEAGRILREINGISSKQNVGPEEVRVKIKLFETCLAPTCWVCITPLGQHSSAVVDIHVFHARCNTFGNMLCNK